MQSCTWLIYAGAASDSGAGLSAVYVSSLVLKDASVFGTPGAFALTNTGYV